MRQRPAAQGRIVRRQTMMIHALRRSPAVTEPLLHSRCFVIITALQWRYRLGVRTEDSQSSNTGSIPVSATSYLPLRPDKSAGFVFASKGRWHWLTGLRGYGGTQNGTQPSARSKTTLSSSPTEVVQAPGGPKRSDRFPSLRFGKKNKNLPPVAQFPDQSFFRLSIIECPLVRCRKVSRLRQV